MTILPVVVTLLLAATPSGAAAGGDAAPAPTAPPVAGTPAAERAEPDPGDPAAPATAPAAELSCAEQIALRVQRRYESVEQLSARFEQRMTSVAFGGSGFGSEPSRGSVAFEKPGRMRWSYETPEPSLVVSDGSTLWIYDPVAKEAQALPVDEGFLSGAAFQFLLGEGDLLASFEVGAVDCEAAEVRLILRPREPSTYQVLEIRADPKSGEVAGTVVEDLFGNRTEVDFEELRTDVPIPADQFRFEAPEGVEIEVLEAVGQP